MILAAYMVTGFLVASVYAVGMLRGRRDRYHRIGFLIPFTVAAIATLTVAATALAGRLATARSGRGALILYGIEAAAAIVVLVFGVALLVGYVASERLLPV